MALTNNDIRFLFYLRQKKVDFSQTLMLGRLRFYGSSEYLKELAGKYLSISGIPSFDDGYSEPFFRMLGAEEIKSMDYSNYENAEIIHDLNLKIPDHLNEKYSVVIDSGTLEHVFNFPQAISNCMNMLRPGGHFISITPANNLMGHGFYQFSPELFYRVFSNENGFTMEKMLIAAADEQGNYNEWFEVTDPLKVKQRVVLINSYPTYLLFYARRNEIKNIFHVMPQQSDYTEAWSRTTSETREQISPLKLLLPGKLRDVLYAARKAWSTKKITSARLGALNEDHFRPFKEF
jgi:SAM-dependent methyltransferase